MVMVMQCSVAVHRTRSNQQQCNYHYHGITRKLNQIKLNNGNGNAVQHCQCSVAVHLTRSNQQQCKLQRAKFIFVARRKFIGKYICRSMTTRVTRTSRIKHGYTQTALSPFTIRSSGHAGLASLSKELQIYQGTDYI